MPELSTGPSGFFPGGMNGTKDRYANPFYGVPQQYLPQNMDQMLLWADHFLLRFGFYRSALSRIANYFITELVIECDDAKAKEEYKNIFKELQWKQVLSQAGLNVLAYGNTFISVSRGFERFLICPKCHKATNIDKVDDYTFNKAGEFGYGCPKCKTTHRHEVVDKPSKDVKKTNIKFWKPMEVKVRHEETTGESEYYWDIPATYITKVMKPNNKFYTKKTPKVFYDAIIQEKMVAFNKDNFIHLKVPTPVGITANGISVPFCIYLFDDFFMLKVLQRFNESICMEDISPFRVIAMADGNSPASNPILNQSGSAWRGAVERMVEEHRRDPGAYHIFPFPVIYEQLGGKGKELVPTELIQQAIGNILNSLNIPEELYSMKLNVQSVAPSLRLFENSWSFIVDLYNQLLNHWAEVIGKIRGLPAAKVGLVSVTLSDDMERKSIIGQLAGANAIARSEMLNLFNFDFEDQLRKKQEEDNITKKLKEEQAAKDALSSQAQGQSPQGAISPNDVLGQAQEIAQKLFPLDGSQRREELQKIKAQDETLWGATKASLQEMTSASKSQGHEQNKQNAKQQSQ